MLTLASTGLPDPDDPTGISVHVAGSPGYEQFERHAFPHRFEPDLVPYDLAPEDSGWEGAGPLTGHTYRFGKDPDWDIRVVMGATQHRYHRPEGAPE